MKLLEKIISKQKLNEKQTKLFETLEFFLKLLLVGLIFQAILYIYPDTTNIQAAFAKLISVLLNPLMTDQFTARGIEIVSGNKAYIITQDCLGWKSMAAYIALVFASSEKFLKHSKAIITGVIVILIANIVRIITTVFLSHNNIISFAIIHDILWKWSLTLLVLVIWIAWYEEIITIEKIRKFR